MRYSVTWLVVWLFPAVASCADTDDKLSLKLTPSWYQSSDGNHAWDFNLRANTGPHAAWLGYYSERSGARQERTGYEYTENFRAGHVVWSAQAASGGFLGGSATLQTASPVYLIAGFGRTNLRNYYNLNFDPNDAYTIGVGTGLIPRTDLSLYEIRDDRLGTGQRVTHLYAHVDLSDTDRVSIDGTYKRGLSDDGVQVHGHGLTLTYTHRHGFLRIAHDPYANFGRATQNRFSVGLTY
ncbi:hypothetical protein [Noviherbaspirillum pedocola]|uniref:YaiO family outer membrane beta-barrel protein n=1 Tax=Noviherbaspirillum pedocola TaxID=2801341 RepID=A0A934SRJ2_9BURK|nr:hypothetical protein [Noviherbaspirillum pedocola]MBK4733836.1 hypothetical protein [Noviherbaspirillum pedocola]